MQRTERLSERLLRYCLQNKPVVLLLGLALLIAGLSTAPFDWELGSLPRDPVPIDAIPDIGENQQIVFTEWAGRSPQDMEDQVTYPLTTALLGLPKVKAIRSFSYLGYASIFLIFDDDAEFYWCRSRILEKLNALPRGLLPEGVTPQLGPDATGLGQVFWYTLEGRDERGQPAGGWSLDELRSVQDWYVRYALQGVDGVAEVASVGGFVREYQVDLDPEALRSYRLTLQDVLAAVQASNLDVGARTIEVNRVEYVVRGLGLLKDLEDLRKSVVAERDHVPITLEQVADISFGPALRRGALDKGGAEAVGGVVVTRFGENPLEVIKRVRAKIEAISPGLPAKTLEDGRISQLTLVPFYDRTGLIRETLGTLESAIYQQVLVTLLVVVLLVIHLRAAGLISLVLPLAVLFAFLAMRLFDVQANIVALSGIAIAIGTVVDMGIVLVENILRHSRQEKGKLDAITLVVRSCAEVSGAILTAVFTTILSFLPVLALEGAEGKLFHPLAYTKTFTLLGAILVALLLLPTLAQWVLLSSWRTTAAKNTVWGTVALASLLAPFALSWFPLWLGLLLIVLAAYHLFESQLSDHWKPRLLRAFHLLLAVLLAAWLANTWKPLGPEENFQNLLFVLLVAGLSLALFLLFMRFYTRLLTAVLAHKTAFLCASILLMGLGLSAWLGWDRLFGWLPESLRNTKPYTAFSKALPGLGKEFMPTLDEGSYLLMPTTMPHASIGEALDVLSKQDTAISAIPEVELAVGKIGRVESPLDPAPISMIETIITYKPEYRSDPYGRILTYAFDTGTGTFQRDHKGDLIPDKSGRPYREWRDEIQSPEDIWEAILEAARVPGTTSAPKLQPIAARLVMLQSGMRAPMGIKVLGPDLDTIETVSLQIEALLKELPSIRAETVLADRIVGKPYLEIDIQRDAIARYGIRMQRVQETIEVAIGGRTVTQTIEGRERYGVRVRYPRERRDNMEALEAILVAAPDGTQVPLCELASIRYHRGPQAIKSENTFLLGYVIFDKQQGLAEIDVVEAARAWLERKQAEGELQLPPGVSYQFTGHYEHQLRAEQRLSVVLPATLLLIWLILFLQFRRLSTTLMVFSGILFAWSGGFLLLWLYGQSWFLDVELFGKNLRSLFNVGPVNLSVAVWVGFLALFGIATDDGVLFCTYLRDRFALRKPTTVEAIRSTTLEACAQRIRPALTTSATTLLALLPVLTSTGRGSDIMQPMAIPVLGGMLLAGLSVFLVPLLYCWHEEIRLKRRL